MSTAFEESFLLPPLAQDGLAQTLAIQPDGARVNVAVGRVLEWEVSTRRNKISIQGGTFADLPAMDTAALTTMVAGNNVLVLMVGNQWIIQGRILDPI